MTNKWKKQIRKEKKNVKTYFWQFVTRIFRTPIGVFDKKFFYYTQYLFKETAYTNPAYLWKQADIDSLKAS